MKAYRMTVTIEYDAKHVSDDDIDKVLSTCDQIDLQSIFQTKMHEAGIDLNVFKVSTEM
jgi:hypothetical protein